LSITYYDPIISIRRGSDTPLVEITENKKVINSVSILSEIASRTQKVSVNGTIGGQNYVFYELPLGSTPSIDTTNYYVYFTVDYVISQVNFPVELEGITLSFNFWGQGCHYFPASRVYSTYENLGNGTYEIETTIQDLCDAVTSTQYKGIWKSTTTYVLNDIVVYGPLNYISLSATNLNQQPDTETIYWQVDDVVKRDSSSYIQVEGIEIGSHMRMKWNSSLSALEIESY